MDLFYQHLSEADPKDLDIPLNIYLYDFLNELEKNGGDSAEKLSEENILEDDDDEEEEDLTEKHSEENVLEDDEEEEEEEREEDFTEKLSEENILEDDIPDFEHQDSDFLNLDKIFIEDDEFYDNIVDEYFKPQTVFIESDSATTLADSSGKNNAQTNESIQSNSGSETFPNSESNKVEVDDSQISELLSSVIEMIALRDERLSHIPRLSNKMNYASDKWIREPKLRGLRRELISYVKINESLSGGISVLKMLRTYFESHSNVSLNQAIKFATTVLEQQNLDPDFYKTVFSKIRNICHFTFKSGKVNPNSEPMITYTTYKDKAKEAGIRYTKASALKGFPEHNNRENLKELFPKAKFIESDGVKMLRRGDWSTGFEVVYFCSNRCMAFTGSSSDLTECAQCGKARDPMYRYFYFSPREKVRDFFENTGLSRVIKDAHKRQKNEGEVEDFFDGQLYKLLSQRCIQNAQLGEDYQQKISLKYFESPWDLAFLVSFDAVPVTFGNSSYDIVVARCLNLPPEERNKPSNTITLMAFPSGIDLAAKKEKSAVKDWDSFFFPFIKDSALASTLGYTVYDEDIGVMKTQNFDHILFGFNGA
ncbi:uncharacterized protein SAPINGB_P006183 [Magnusiomyces paraingens]|uniref:Uncharacterized protein n=1 Tax=Magnusiomyces paraingens TaxID=2606893 RepID=A0A5E8C4V4_9ASCO|nr:uncharacterized protein SAPINGB_P006183 [Saprochaete ingens]VVT58392.1 unnamed protein product [Saprochaete ingens]